MLLAATEIPVAPVLIFMGLGVLIAIAGHVWRSRTFIVAGILVLFLGTAAMFVAAYVAYKGGDETDPRPPCGETVRECEKEGERP